MNVIITHGPVVEMEEENYEDRSTIRFTLEDGRHVNVDFSVRNGSVFRSVNGFIDELDFIDTVDDAIQWTVDNWCEIEEAIQ